MKQILFALIGAIFLSIGVTHAACTKDNLIVDGIFGRGSVVCTDGKWLDRRASVLIANAAKECSYKGYAWVLHYIKRGGLDFENKRKELGKEVACKMVDDAMTFVEKDAPTADEGDGAPGELSEKGCYDKRGYFICE